MTCVVADALIIVGREGVDKNSYQLFLAIYSSKEKNQHKMSLTTTVDTSCANVLSEIWKIIIIIIF